MNRPQILPSACAIAIALAFAPTVAHAADKGAEKLNVLK